MKTSAGIQSWQPVLVLNADSVQRLKLKNITPWAICLKSQLQIWHCFLWELSGRLGNINHDNERLAQQILNYASRSCPEKRSLEESQTGFRPEVWLFLRYFWRDHFSPELRVFSVKNVTKCDHVTCFLYVRLGMKSRCFLIVRIVKTECTIAVTIEWKPPRNYGAYVRQWSILEG